MRVKGPGGGVEFPGEGLDNLTYVVNGELVVRFSKEPELIRRAELIHTETRLLAVVAKMSPLPVPEPVFTDPGRGWWAYAKIPGVPLLNLPLRWRLVHARAAGATLGGFLAVLHAAPLAQMARLAWSVPGSRQRPACRRLPKNVVMEETARADPTGGAAMRPAVVSVTARMSMLPPGSAPRERLPEARAMADSGLVVSGSVI